MNSEQLNKEWGKVCSHVIDNGKVNASQVKAFFSRLQPQAMSEDFLMLTADNEFIKTWIEKHYLAIIQQALKEVYGVDFTVEIEVDPSAQAAHENVPTQQEASKEKPIEEKREPAPVEKTPVKPIIESKEEYPNDLPISSLTFENFVIGDSNSMAYNMALAVAEEPGKPLLNPLFIYGKSGLGKTHLLRAIQKHINDNMPEMKTVYIDGAEFLSGFVEATVAHDKEKTSYKNFNNRFLKADVLLLDDVQYLQGKKQTLDAVFQIFNTLIDKGKQIVLSADRAPKNIDIDERYQSRFNSGGTIDIQPPEVETKLGIVKSLIDEYRSISDDDSFTISDTIQKYIAENSSSNIRELKSAVTKVIYRMNTLGGRDLTLEEVQELLENHFSGGSMKKLSIPDIQKKVEEFYKVPHSDLVGKKRSRDIVYARQIAIYLCRQMLDLPYNYIGKNFGNRDHTTIMYSVTNIEEKIKDDRTISEEIETIKQLIKEM